MDNRYWTALVFLGEGMIKEEKKTVHETIVHLDKIVGPLNDSERDRLSDYLSRVAIHG